MQRSDLHTRTCQSAAASVMKEYSTSFSLAARLLPPHIRTHITSIYALVRVADEVVDGAFVGSTPAERINHLDALQARVREAVDCGFSTDPYVHAFAWTARRVGIGPAQWTPFFDSMRADADPQPHGPESLRTYVHGSAAVVGEMCLLAFHDGAPVPTARRAELLAGAHALGSAFQTVNFLRDLREDTAFLGRSYLAAAPSAGLGETRSDVREDVTALTEEWKTDVLADIRTDLRTARAAIPLLPPSVRPAVRLAHDLFAALADTLDGTAASTLAHTRVRVTPQRKLVLAAAAVGRRGLPGMVRG